MKSKRRKGSAYELAVEKFLISQIKKREEEIIKGNEELERRFKQLEKGIKNKK
jgi:hypothetical protein